MTLRARAGFGASAFVALVVIVFGGVVDLGYRSQLERQLKAVLLQDLERAAVLFERPILGASFTGAGDVATVLQFIDADGRVALAWGDEAPLPAVGEPKRITRGERLFLVAQTPWPAAGGWIRMAHDVTAAMGAARDVRAFLRWGGAAVIAAAAIAAWAGAGWFLRPLADLADQTRRVDPARPGSVAYRGPRDEVHALAAALNAALGSIRRRRDEERAFLLEVAHELSAPLTLVHYHLDGLRRRDPEDGRLRAASDAARELLRTSQDLLVAARGDLERQLEAELVDLGGVARRVADEYPGIGVVADGGAHVLGDRERLMQVLRNLVRNAVQASGGVEGVAVVVRADAGGHRIEVRDAGPGMTPEALAHAFERGVPGANRGAGVGLAVARSLAELHGGTLRVASTSAAGTVMEVRLPDVEARIDEGDGEA